VSLVERILWSSGIGIAVIVALAIIARVAGP
jgi:hypothetical protein